MTTYGLIDVISTLAGGSIKDDLHPASTVCRKSQTPVLARVMCGDTLIFIMWTFVVSRADIRNRQNFFKVEQKLELLAFCSQRLASSLALHATGLPGSLISKDSHHKHQHHVPRRPAEEKGNDEGVYTPPHFW